MHFNKSKMHQRSQFFRKGPKLVLVLWNCTSESELFHKWFGTGPSVVWASVCCRRGYLSTHVRWQGWRSFAKKTLPLSSLSPSAPLLFTLKKASRWCEPYNQRQNKNLKKGGKASLQWKEKKSKDKKNGQPQVPTKLLASASIQSLASQRIKSTNLGRPHYHHNETNYKRSHAGIFWSLLKKLHIIVSFLAGRVILSSSDDHLWWVFF